MPAALVYIGQSSINQHNHGIFDTVILILASIFMGLTVFQSINKPYFKKIVFLLILGGICFLLSFAAPTPFNHFLFVGGSVFWLIGHIINFRSSHKSVKANV